MPIYEYVCDKCLNVIEKLQDMDTSPPLCCGQEMRRKPTFPAMVKIKGMGGYPSRRKMIKDTAPYSSK